MAALLEDVTCTVWDCEVLLGTKNVNVREVGEMLKPELPLPPPPAAVTVIPMGIARFPAVDVMLIVPEKLPAASDVGFTATVKVAGVVLLELVTVAQGMEDAAVKVGGVEALEVKAIVLDAGKVPPEV